MLPSIKLEESLRICCREKEEGACTNYLPVTPLSVDASPRRAERGVSEAEEKCWCVRTTQEAVAIVQSWHIKVPTSSSLLLSVFAYFWRKSRWWWKWMGCWSEPTQSSVDSTVYTHCLKPPFVVGISDYKGKSFARLRYGKVGWKQIDDFTNSFSKSGILHFRAS